jgi:hypothetical protein
MDMKKWGVRSHRSTSIAKEGQISLATPPPSAATPSETRRRAPLENETIFKKPSTLVGPSTHTDTVTQNSRSQAVGIRTTSVTASPETPRKNNSFRPPGYQTSCLSPSLEASPARKRKQTDLSDYEDNGVNGSDSELSSPLAIRKVSRVGSSKRSPALKKPKIKKLGATKSAFPKAGSTGKIRSGFQAKGSPASTPSTPPRTPVRRTKQHTPSAPSKPSNHTLALPSSPSSPSSPLTPFSTIRSPNKRRTALIAQHKIHQLNAIDEEFSKSEEMLAAKEREARVAGPSALPDRIRRMSLTPVPTVTEKQSNKSGVALGTVASLTPPVYSGAGGNGRGYGHSQWTRDRAEGDRHLSHSIDALLGADCEGEVGDGEYRVVNGVIVEVGGCELMGAT